MGSTIRCGVCSTCLTLLVSADSSGGGLGRTRLVSRRRVLFSFFTRNYCSDPSYLFVRLDTYQSNNYHLSCRNIYEVDFPNVGRGCIFLNYKDYELGKNSSCRSPVSCVIFFEICALSCDFFSHVPCCCWAYLSKYFSSEASF